MKKRWLIAIVSLLSLAGVLLSSGFGVTYAYFFDRETSAGNVFTAWTSQCWTQTTQAEFDAGVKTNVVTQTGTGDDGSVVLASGGGGGTPVPITNSPSNNSGVWSNPTNAYADSGTSANVISSSPPSSHTFYGYGFNIPAGSTIQQVRVRYDAWITPRTGNQSNDYLWVYVSWNGGINWSPHQVNGNLTQSETTYWYPVTGATTWDATKLNDSNLRVRVDAEQQGQAERIDLDWLPVEVTYTTAGGYTSPGYIASQVLNAGRNGATWDALIWNETIPLPDGTDITFEVRAWDDGDPIPGWTPIAGDSPILSGLPDGQYKQWRATLTTSSNPTNTPTLYEVRVWYDP